MHRLFLALRPPRELRQRLLQVMDDTPGIRWQSDDQLHLTLRFIGEVDRHHAEEIAIAMGSIFGPPPTVLLHGGGTFARRDRPHTVWAGVQPDPGLLRLRERIERAIVATGLPPETRAFKPHVTVARLGRHPPDLTPVLRRLDQLAASPVVIDRFVLFESNLSSDGPLYEAVARYPLT